MEKGNDFTKSRLGELIRAVNDVEGVRRIRLGSLEPRIITEEFAKSLAELPKFCPHFHLSLQSGCDSVLQRMNRHYTTAEYRRHVEDLRSAIPDVSITTDLIVGFPDETEELFEQTLSFVSEMKFDAAFTFLYSKRSGTPAADMEEQIPQSVKQSRLQRLMDLQNDIALSLNQRWVGREVDVLVDGPSKTDPTVYSGRTSQNKIVLWPAEANDQAGSFRTVKIDSAQTFLLKGNAISERNG